MVTSSTNPSLRRSALRADCDRCFALCCTAFGFARSADFAEDKPAGSPCRHLDDRHSCTIHTVLRDRGFRGCTAFDCFGAGQAVSQRLFSGVSWRERPDTRHHMFAAFGVLRQVHEMIWYLAEAQERTYDVGIRQQVRDLTESLESLSRGNVEHLLAADMGSVHASVRTLLVEVSAEVRGSYFADDGGLDPRIGPGADLAGCDLRRTRLCGADLRGAVLIGADLRECDLTAVDLLGADLRDARMAGADLAASLYLTQPQIAAARGDADTRLPAAVSAPFHW